MSVLDAFYSVWSHARETFGVGVPQDGSQFGDGSRLRQMQSMIESAAPDDRWQGTASQAYAAKNAEHAAVYGKLADLDQRMAAEVTRAAGVVTTGRQTLDQIHAWVTDAAASVPSGESGERAKLAIANRGIGQVNDVIRQSNGEMAAIGERIQGLGRDYDDIGGPKQGGPDTGDKPTGTEIPGPKPPPEPDDGQAPHGSQPWYSRADDLAFKELAEKAADAAEARGWTNAARHLRHYLENSGEDLVIDPDQLQRDVPKIQQQTDTIVNAEVQRIAAEAAATGNYGTPVPFQSEWKGPYIRQEDNPDWFYAMGGIQQSVTGVVTVQPPTVPGGEPTVSVDYQTHIFDRYNWDGTKSTTIPIPGTDGITITDARMGALHTAGIAQEYNITGTGSVFHYDGTVPSNAPLNLPSAPDNRDGTRSDPGRPR